MPSAPAVATTQTLHALALANLRYWTTVHPLVRHELRRWERRAAAIPDPTWRAIARDKLQAEHFNAQVAATLATLAPPRRREPTVRAIVAAEVLYDYLDGASEQTAGDPRVYAAFTTAFGREVRPADDRFADDGGYAHELATTCRTARSHLPAADAVTAAVHDAAERCATAQTLTHRIADDGHEPLQAWAASQASRHRIAWWELAAGGAASILAIHALIAAAASEQTTAADAAAIDDAYLLACALSTLLDSLVDSQHDEATGAHSFIAYYADDAARARGIAAIARRAASAASQLPHGAHHAMTVAGVAGYYLSAPGASAPAARPIAAAVERELQPMLRPVLAIFAAWRAAKRLRARSGRDGPLPCAETVAAALRARTAPSRDMPPPQTRADLDASVRRALAALQRELDAVADTGAADVPCVEDWTVKDVLAVRVAWAEMTGDWIEAGLRGENPPTPAPGYTWRQTPALNAAIVAREADTTLPALRTRLVAAVERLLALADQLDDEDLLRPDRFAWTRTWPVIRWIATNTATQQTTARTLIRRTLRARTAGTA